MKSFVFITIILAAVSARKRCPNYKEGDRYFHAAGDDGKTYLVDSREEVDEHAISNYTCCPVKVGYWLYTRKNPEPEYKQDLIMDDKNSVIKSYFDAKKITVFTCHGWKGDGYSEINEKLTEVLLQYHDYNVIVVDWSGMSKKGYVTARMAVPKVGRMVGRFINWLSKNFNLNLGRVHLIGHSLGGHLVGNAGKELRGQVARISALDPAGPLWYSDRKHRVAKTDALYVEVIHTNAFQYGYAYQCGLSDHYPNGGMHMPGCKRCDISCNHSRSWRYMASSIINDKFNANKCKDIHEAFHRRCTGKMGDAYLSSSQRGVFRANTKAHYPYV